jgi:hypothetical protein
MKPNVLRLRRIRVRLASLATIAAAMTLLPTAGCADTLSFNVGAGLSIAEQGLGPTAFDIGGIEQITFTVFSDPAVFAATGADAVINYDISYTPRVLANCVAPTVCGGYVDDNILAANGALSTGSEGSYNSQQNDIVTFGSLTGTLFLRANTYAVTVNAESSGYGPDLTTTGNGAITANFTVVQGEPVFLFMNPEPGTMGLFLAAGLGCLFLKRRRHHARFRHSGFNRLAL